jgi:tetratricopeptide (TPR) repeat protein
MMLRPWIISVLAFTALVAGTVPVRAAWESDAERESALATAVALNYCRASFHRIRKDPTNEILREEQEKILNNLNLSKLEDPEVISLYTAVLDEIGQIEMTEKEEKLYTKHHGAAIRRQLTWDALAFGTDLATAQFGSAVRTGANSWWDYRNRAFQRDNDILKIEKNRLSSVVQRSNQFLDTIWKLARKKKIPDRWLVRGDDLDQLDTTMREQDGEVRVRILRRMETFMEAYPPYWYYLGRTYQELGEMEQASECYRHLEKLGGGHFRKDDMLATAMANLAAIQDYHGETDAVATARKALDYSTDVWEANLIAARILQRHGQVADAEDAIFRNLDVRQEENQSHIFLASLYYFTGENEKLTGLLNNPRAVARLPAPVLLRCAAKVGTDNVPAEVMRNVVASLEAYPRSTFGRDQLVVRVNHAWQLHLARLEVSHDGRRLSEPQVVTGRGFHDLRYSAGVDWGRNFPMPPATPEVTLKLTYPDETVVTLVLKEPGGQSAERTAIAVTGMAPLRISDIQVSGETVSLKVREASRAGQFHTATDHSALPEDAVPLPPLLDGYRRTTQADGKTETH